MAIRIAGPKMHGPDLVHLVDAGLGLQDRAYGRHRSFMGRGHRRCLSQAHKRQVSLAARTTVTPILADFHQRETKTAPEGAALHSYERRFRRSFLPCGAWRPYRPGLRQTARASAAQALPSGGPR